MVVASRLIDAAMPLPARTMASTMAAVALAVATASMSIAQIPGPRNATAATSPDSSLTPAERDTLLNLRALIRLTRYGAAEARARDMLAATEKSHGEESLQAALMLDVLVESLWRGGKSRAPGSRGLAERAVRLKEQLLGPDHPSLGASLFNLAALLYGTGDYVAARPFYERSLAIREKALGPDHPDVAVSLNGLALLLRQLNDPAAARPLLERALKIREKALGPEDRDVAASLSNLAVELWYEGDYAGARSLHERALAIREKVLGPDHIEVAASLDGLAAVLTDTGDYSGAQPLYERSLAILEKALGPDHPMVGQILNNFGSSLLDMGDAAAARPILERAAAIREKVLGPDHPELGRTLDNLAVLLYRTGDVAGARPLQERALAIREKALGPDHPLVAASMTNLANVRWAAGDTAGARQLYERALSIREKALGPNHPDVARNLSALAFLLRFTGHDADARPLLERALAIREEALGPDHPFVAQTLSDLARIDLDTGNFSGAIVAGLRAESIAYEHFQTSAQVLPERQALALAAMRPAGLDLALSLLSQDSDLNTKRSILDAEVRARAQVLDEMGARHRATSVSADSETARLQATYRAATKHIAGLLAHGPDPAHPERYRPLVDQARQERERSERALSERSAVFRRQQHERTIGLSEVVSALPQGTGLLGYVSYSRYDRQQHNATTASYLAYVIHGQSGEIDVVRLGEASDIDSLVTRWSDEAGRGVLNHLPDHAEAAYRKAGTALRERVWDPILPYLRGVKRLFVVPDGALNLVNLATLPVENGHYLVETGPLLQTLSAERDLVTVVEYERGGKGLLAMGFPAYDGRPAEAPVTSGKPGEIVQTSVNGAYRGARSDCAEFAGWEFSPLPGTLDEVREVGQLWRSRPGRVAGAGTTLEPVLELTGAQASEQAFKREAPGRAVLHLATHGFFIIGNCRSTLNAAAPETGMLPADPAQLPPGLEENPLVLSGLALAGANRRQQATPEDDDGILTAEEIASLDLSGVQWAVLSACQTGTGDVQAGEGVFGLRRAFRVAGAHTLIMSLWAVEDQMARRWMIELYRERYERGLGTADAVQKASMTILRERRANAVSTHPFYWGAFVAAGDWR